MGWLGEVDGIEISIRAAEEKLGQMTQIVRLTLERRRPNGENPTPTPRGSRTVFRSQTVHHPFRCVWVSAGGYGASILGVSHLRQATSIGPPKSIVFGGSPGTTSTAKSRMIESWRLSCFISPVAPAGLRLAVVFLRRYEKQATTNRRFTTDSSGRRRTRAQSRSRAPPRSPWMATISFRGRGEAMTSPAVFTAPLLGWPGCQRLNRFERRSPLMATDEDVACTCCGRHLPRKKLHALGDDRAFICRRCGWWVALRLHRDRPPA